MNVPRGSIPCPDAGRSTKTVARSFLILTTVHPVCLSLAECLLGANPVVELRSASSCRRRSAASAGWGGG